MKKITFLLTVVLLTATVSVSQNVDATKKEDVKKEVSTTLDNLHTFLKTKNLPEYSNLLAEDGLFCGTDSKEFWDKASLLEIQKEMFTNPEMKFDYTLNKRVIKVAEDGKSVLVVEQFISPELFSPHIPVRFTSHFVQKQDGWKVDFLGWSLVPDNEDLVILVKALEE